MKKNGKSLTLNKRIALIPCSVFIPMLLVVIYLAVTLIRSADAYSAITESVMYANFYSKEFKERMDYSMYLAVISSKTTEELGDGKTTINGVVTVDPYQYIEELSDVCDELSDMATASINKKKIIQVNNSLKSLKKCVTELERMITDNGSYDEKMDYLDENIRGRSGLTTVIQGALQEYVYNETKNFDEAKDELRIKTRNAVEMTVIALCITVVIAVGLSILAVRSVTLPIKKLCSQTRKVAKGDFTAKTKIETVDEISVLTDSFNDMTAEIGVLVDNIKKQEKNLRITESRLMQAQINPHFLYNTLDAIIWLAEEKKTDDVVSMVNSLSEFFRTTLSKGKDYITVKEEKSHVESYLEIQQYRYQDIMDYEIDMAEDIYLYMIPKLTLQPLVENALYHGIKNKRGKGTIRITGWKEGGRIFLKVTDNGIGMSEEALNKLRRSIYGINGEADESGFGLANVNQRLQYYFGEEYGVFFESEENAGTEATVIMQAKNITPLS